MDNKNKSKDMPEPQVFNYDVFYRISPLFINDLKKVLGDLPYVESQKFFNEIEMRGGVFPSAILNEFIRKISNLPYKYVCNLMGVIGNRDCFQKYFVQLTKEEIEAAIKTQKNNG